MFKQSPMCALCTLLCLFLSWGFSFATAQSSCQISGNSAPCQNTEAQYTLSTNVPQPYTVAWSVVGGVPVSSNNSGITVAWPLSGSHSLVATISTGSSSTTCTLTVDVLPAPPIRNLSNYANLCPGEITQVSTTSCEGCTYLWTAQGGVSVSPNNLSSTNLSIDGPGVYCVTTTSANGCTASDCGDVTLPAQINIPVNVAGAQSTGPNTWEVCPNQPVTFGIDPNLKALEWEITDGSNTWNLSGTEISFSFPTPGAYSYTVTANGLGVIPGADANNCLSITPQIIHVLESLPVPISCPSVVCEGTQVTYTVPAGCSGGSNPWTVSPQGTIVGTPTATSVTVIWSYTNGDPDGYVVYNGQCPGYCPGPSIVQVPIIPTQGTINGQGGVCFAGTLSWTTPFFVGGQYHWSYSPNPTVGVTQVGSNTSNTYQLQFTNAFQGSITIRLEFEHPIAGCSYVVEKVVQSGFMSGSISGPSTICPDAVGNPQTFTYNFNGPLTWTLRQGTNTSPWGSTTGPAHSIEIPANTLTPGLTYSLIATNSAGCTKSKSFTVQLPLVGAIDGPSEVCPNVSYEYTVTNPGPLNSETFEWQITQNGVQSSQFGSTVNISWPPGTGSIKLIRTRNNCSNLVDEMTVTILPVNGPLTINGPAATCPDILQDYFVTPDVADGCNWSIVDPATNQPSNLGSIFSGQGTTAVQIQWLGVTVETTVNLVVTATLCGIQTTATMAVTLTPFQFSLQTPTICEGENGQIVTDISGADGYTVYVDGNLVYANSTTLNPIPASYLQAGPHTILVVVRNPEGCAGTSTQSSTLTVQANPSFKISIDGFLPCPKGSPFVRQLSVSPASSACNYIWTRNGADFGVGPIVTITEPGNYLVVSDCNGCPPKSAEFNIDYDCDNCCEEDIQGNDISVILNSLELSAENCNQINFAGIITPYQLAHNPRWTIIKPGGDILEIPITDPSPDGIVKGYYQAIEVGYYHICLSADEIWEDISIIAQNDEGEIITFENYCDFQDAGGAKVFPKFKVIYNHREAYCTRSDCSTIQVPFIADFISQVKCNADGTFSVHAQDATAYDAGVTSSISWDYPGGSQSGSSMVIPSVAAGSNFSLCMKVAAQNGYACKRCENISTPPPVSVGIDVDSDVLCQFQTFQFNPLIYPPANSNQVVGYHWDFGDGSFSNMPSPFKVYTLDGTFTVTLTVETRFGCFISSSVTITVSTNNIPEGEIVVKPGACNSYAILTFVQSSGPAIDLYSWHPVAPNSPSITVNQNILNYGLTVTGDNGCTNVIDPVDVEISDPWIYTPQVIAGCRRISVNTFGDPAYEYSWTWSPATPGYNQPFTGSPNITLIDIAPGTYTFTVTASQGGSPCTSTVISGTAHPEPPVPVVTQTVSCQNDQMWITLTVTNAPPDVEIEWLGPGLSISGSNSIQIGQNGLYKVQFRNAFGCVKTTDINIDNIINFSLFLSGCYDCDILDNPPVYLEGIPGSFDSWYWEIDMVAQPAQSGPVTALELSTDYEKIRLCITESGCTLCSDFFCLLDCEQDTCQVPRPTIRRVQCLDETVDGSPGMTRYFVHWDFPTDGLVQPCPSGPPSIYQSGTNTSVGNFEDGFFQFEQIPGFWHFEGTFLLNSSISPAQVCWDIPFCLISTGAHCADAQVCPVDYPNYDPYYSCTNPNGPFKECEDFYIKLIDVQCEEDPNTSIDHLVTLHIEGPVPPTTCGEYAIMITSITGDLLYPISGQYYNLTGPTLSTDVVLGWASNFANDILCLEVVVREDYDCWPLTFLDDPNTAANEAGKICLKRECFDLSAYKCPEHEPGEPVQYGFTAKCDKERSKDGIAVYQISINWPFAINPLGFNLSSSTGNISGLTLAGNNINFIYETNAGNLLFFATLTNNGSTYYIQRLLEDCGFIGKPGGDRSKPASHLLYPGAQLKLMPNPTSGLVNIQFDLGAQSGSEAQLSIYNMHGTLLSRFVSAEKQGVWGLQVKDWNTGVYLVVLKDGNGAVRETRKLIVKFE